MTVINIRLQTFPMPTLLAREVEEKKERSNTSLFCSGNSRAEKHCHQALQHPLWMLSRIPYFALLSGGHSISWSTLDLGSCYEEIILNNESKKKKLHCLEKPTLQPEICCNRRRSQPVLNCNSTAGICASYSAIRVSTSESLFFPDRSTEMNSISVTALKWQMSQRIWRAL